MEKREPEIDRHLRLVVKHGGTGLDLEVGAAPGIWLRGALRRVDSRPLTQEDLLRMLSEIINAQPRQTLEENGEVEFTYFVGADENRFNIKVMKRPGQLRVNAHRLEPT